MKISWLSKVSRECARGMILFVAIFSGVDVAIANPGLVPGWDGETSHVDFSDLPVGNPVRQGIDTWQAQDWNGRARCI